MALDTSRRAQLNFAKLKVLAASAGANALTPLGFPGGAAASGDGTLWVLGDNSGVGLLGSALSVALRGVVPDRLVVITDDAGDAGVIVRRAEYFATPAKIDVATVDGTSLAISTRITPFEGAMRVPIGEEEVPEGVEVVHEHGVTSFEVKGLEIGRIENGELAVGVGKHDREAHRMANSGSTLADLRDRINKERRHDAPGSAATSYARERWLRSIVVTHPEIVGLGPLTPVAPPTPREDLRNIGVAPAVGDGVVVAFSVGVDPDVIPSAADARAMHQPDADLVLVLPEADLQPNTHRLNNALHRPARVITVQNDWAALGD